MKKVKVKNLEIAYNVTGSGDPLILIGGFAMAKETWTNLVTRLSKTFRVIIFDNRGMGETTVTTEPFTIADMADDIVGLMDALEIESAHFFGVSMGGLIAQSLALDYPSRVKMIALGCTTHGGRHAIQSSKETMTILGGLSDPNRDPEDAIRMKLPIMFSDQFLREHQEETENFVRISLDSHPTIEGAKGQSRALSVFNVRRRLGEIKCPVLAITGSKDRMISPKNSKLLADGVPSGKLYVVNGAGHAFYYEKPDEVSQELTRFFKEGVEEDLVLKIQNSKGVYLPPVSYMERIRDKYNSLGYPEYRWEYNKVCPPWQPLSKPLDQCRLGLVASGGIYVTGQTAFHFKDDISLREIPMNVVTKDLRATHFAYDLTDARSDPNVVFPIDTLRHLVRKGVIGELAKYAYTFMGGIYSTRRIRESLMTQITERLLFERVDAVLFVPV